MLTFQLLSKKISTFTGVLHNRYMEMGTNPKYILPCLDFLPRRFKKPLIFFAFLFEKDLKNMISRLWLQFKKLDLTLNILVNPRFKDTHKLHLFSYVKVSRV